MSKNSFIMPATVNWRPEFCSANDQPGSISVKEGDEQLRLSETDFAYQSLLDCGWFRASNANIIMGIVKEMSTFDG